MCTVDPSIMGINLGLSWYGKNVFQWPCYLLDTVPHDAHSCNQSSTVAAMLTFRRPGTITQPSNHLIYLKWTTWDGSASAVLVQCMCSACAVHVQCLCSACAVHVQCKCSTCAVHVQCMCSACAVLVQCLCSACAVHVQCLCSACAVHVQCLCSASPLNRSPLQPRANN